MHADRYGLLEATAPLRELLRDFTYRPGWHFQIKEGQLVISAEVIDAANHSKIIHLQFGIGIPMHAHLMRDFDWQHWLFEQVIFVERHEAREFFKIRGVAVYDPHA